MLAPIILFVVSGLGIISLLGVKIYQLFVGVNLPLAAKRNVVESKVKGVKVLIQSRAIVIKNTFHPVAFKRIITVIGITARKFYRDLKTALTMPGHWLDRRTRNLVSLVHGRQPLPGKGEPSSYLRDISQR